MTRTVHGSKANAERALKALVVEVESGRLPRTGATVGELLEAWFAVASPGFSPRTVLETRGVMDRRLLPDLGLVALRHLSVARLDGYYAGLLEHGSVGGEGLAPGSVRRIHGVLRRALHYGVRWGWLMVNPAAEAVLAAVPPPRVSPPSTPGVARLYALAQREDPLLGLFVFVAAVTGARRSELCALRWSNLAIDDADRAVMVVDRAVVFGPDGLVVKPTKSRQSRRIALDQATVARLTTYRRHVEAVVAMLGGTLASDGYVFSRDPFGATALFPDSVTRSFRRLCAKAGIEGVRLHDLRHYVATELISAGVDVRTVAGRLGHRDASTTLNIYAGFRPESDRAAAELLAGTITRAIDVASET